MGYSSRRATIKCWYPHNNTLKYCSSEKYDEHNNKFGKVRSPGSEIITGTNISTLPTFKKYLSDHPFVIYGIFGVTVNFPPRGNPIGIFEKYCEHHNMSYISQSTNDIPWNRAFTVINSTNVWILNILIK